MLITRRRVGEALVIGDNVEVHVLEISQGRVKLGVAAPADLRVDRKEWKIVEDQNRNATSAASSDFVQHLLGRTAPTQDKTKPPADLSVISWKSSPENQPDR